jgi:hypothetical protein
MLKILLLTLLSVTLNAKHLHYEKYRLAYVTIKTRSREDIEIFLPKPKNMKPDTICLCLYILLQN